MLKKLLKTIFFILVGIPMGLCFWVIFKIESFVEEYIIYDIKRIWKGEI